jgi:signal transduction histidine kinase
MPGTYAPERRAERLIATGRMVLAVVLLVALRFAPEVTPRRAAMFELVLICYVFYSLFLALLEWSLRTPLARIRLLTHLFDLGIFAMFVFVSEDPASPFFVFFVFSLLCATLRWRWRGVVATTVTAIVAYAGLGLYGRRVLEDPHFTSSTFIFRGVYLVVVAAMLTYIGAYEERVRGELSRLAEWPRAVPWETPALAGALLEYATGVVGAPRALLTWEEPEEPWRHLASWAAGRLELTRESVTTLDTVVAGPLAAANFLCSDAGEKAPPVLHTSASGLKWWRGEPVPPTLRERFQMGSVLGLAIRADSVEEGHLFLLDKTELTSDDLVLGEIVARQTGARLDHFYLLQRLRQLAATEERVRVARDLHDGVLQTLAGTALQLETVSSLVDETPQAARERILEIQRLLSAEQRELREFIQQLRPATLGVPVRSAALGTRLEELKARIERQWNLRVELSTAQLDRVPDRLGYEVYRIVQEALVNAARHAHASVVRATVDAAAGEVAIDVTDDGRGFAFHGRHDLAELQAMGIGPVSLRERVAAQGGSLVVDSSETGSRLAIRLPLARVLA